jgi:hypothetical protein
MSTRTISSAQEGLSNKIRRRIRECQIKDKGRRNKGWVLVQGSQGCRIKDLDPKAICRHKVVIRDGDDVSSRGLKLLFVGVNRSSFVWVGIRQRDQCAYTFYEDKLGRSWIYLVEYLVPRVLDI